MFPTKTTLIGKDALLYQVYFNEALVQSQLTTITKGASGKVYRTRSAQGFDPITQVTTSSSYYRERKVTKEDFYAEFSQAIVSYNIKVEDLCKTDPTSQEIGSMEKCIEHLEYSFLL